MGEITSKQKNMLDYVDDLIANWKSDKQILAIELSEKKKREERMQELRKQSLERVKAEPRTLFINHLYQFVKEWDITEEMIDIEQEFII